MATLDVEAMAHELRRMALPDDGGGVAIPEAATDAPLADYNLCALDLVLEGGPYTFDQNLLALHALAPGDSITQVPLHDVDFWVHAYDFKAELYSETVGKALGYALGRFLVYDEYNPYTDQDSCMRLKVKLDVWKSLLREKEVKKPSSSILVATLRRGGGDRRGQVRSIRPRPGNIQALAINFCIGILKGTPSLSHGLDDDASKEVVVEVSEDRKRRKWNESGEADLDVYKENALNLVISNGSTGR
ncbi:hypothetical protein LINGRAHAP2_LOCUS24768 [Linum grandiflorum]